jgi:hypothetical protein
MLRIGAKPVLTTLRIVHGAVLTFSIVFDVTYLLSTFAANASTTPLPRKLGFVVLYSGSLLVQLAIALFAWERFDICSFRTAATLYAVWLIFFVWHGWFGLWAPFRSHGDSFPEDQLSGYVTTSLLVLAWLLSYSIFPLLRLFAAKKSK